MSQTTALKAKRKYASEQSGGVSGSHLYKRCLGLLAGLDIAGEVLDFGAGRGQFTSLLSKSNQFSMITGADLLPRPAVLDSSIQWLEADLNEDSSLPAEGFDVIVALEVIEHLENPRDVARKWHRWLRPGGTLVMSTPNNESWRALLSLVLRGHFVAFTGNSYPAHITALVRQDLNHILREAGFADTKFAYSNIGSFPKIPLMTWQQLSAGWLKGLRYSDNIFVIAKKPL